jgi:hypothetical protein
MHLQMKSAPVVLRASSLVAACLALAGLGGCSKGDLGTSSGPVADVPAFEVAGGGGGVDILFMIDNSSSMSSMQQKLVAQIPAFLTILQGAAQPLTDFHIAVVSSDLGAPGDLTASIGCSATGDQGIFQSQPRGDCQALLDPGATFISNVGGVANYTGALNDALAASRRSVRTGAASSTSWRRWCERWAPTDIRLRPPTRASCAGTRSWPSFF